MSMIIDQPALVSLPRRLSWGCVTIAFWAAWCYLWLPLLTLAAWSIGMHEAYDQFRLKHEINELKRLACLYAMVIAALGGTLLLWALSEFVRFRNSSRRLVAPPAQAEDLAQHVGLPAGDLAAWQSQRCIVAYHDNHGQLLSAEALNVTPSYTQRAACTPLLVAASSVAG